jgi:hypothetical protein
VLLAWALKPWARQGLHWSLRWAGYGLLACALLACGRYFEAKQFIYTQF